MEYRKLIGFGKNSFVVSLPKSWIESNKLKKGDLIYINQKTDELSLYPRHKEIDKKREVTINIDGKQMPRITREITTAYINHFSSIVIVGKEVEKKSKEVRSIIQNLMGLEILEQSANRMVAKDLIDLESVSLIDLIRKMDMIARDMMSDAKNTIAESKYENLYVRDEAVNRLSHLVLRVSKHSLDNPHLAKKLGHTPIETMRMWRVTYAIETIADLSKSIAKYLHNSEATKPEAKRIYELYSGVEELYLASMKTFYNRDGNAAIGLSGIKKELVANCNDFLDKVVKDRNIVSAVEKIKTMAVISNEIGRVVSDISFEDERVLEGRP